ncbi:hypothetical protein P7L64_08170 [Tistrella bauzanensis]|uniref:hypothetical protein n=1 Tax=Tistrella bauzanensis TaxID=657419 RepID=UPI0035586CAC
MNAQPAVADRHHGARPDAAGSMLARGRRARVGCTNLCKAWYNQDRILAFDFPRRD